MKWTLYLSVLSKSIKILMHNKCIMHGAGISYITGRLCMHQCIAQQVTYETSYYRKGRKRWFCGLTIKSFWNSFFYTFIIFLRYELVSGNNSYLASMSFRLNYIHVYVIYTYKMPVLMLTLCRIYKTRRMHIPLVRQYGLGQRWHANFMLDYLFLLPCFSNRAPTSD